MRVRVESRRVGDEWKPFKCLTFVAEDLRVNLSAYEYEDDQWSTREPEGDVIEEVYEGKDIIKALEKFLDAVKRGYEDVELSITSKEKNKGSVTVRITNEKLLQVFASVSLEDEEELSKCEQKLAKIKKVLEEG